MNTRHRVSLKIPSYEDYIRIYEFRFTPEVTYWADDVDPKLSMEDYAMGRLMSQNTGEVLERIIVVDGVPVGTVSARDFEAKYNRCTLGIVIANPAYWGHGYGYAALRMFNCVMADEGIGHVILETYANNKRALRCFTKLGFQKRRVFFSPSSGRFVVQMTMSLTARRPIGEVIRPGDPRWRRPC